MADGEASGAARRRDLKRQADERYGAARTAELGRELEAIARSLALVEAEALEPGDPAPSLIRAAPDVEGGPS